MVRRPVSVLTRRLRPRWRSNKVRWIGWRNVKGGWHVMLHLRLSRDYVARNLLER